MHFSRVTLKTPCTSTLKSNVALSGLKAHVKLKATLGVGMKNVVALYINQVERVEQHLDEMESFSITNSSTKQWLRRYAQFHVTLLNPNISRSQPKLF